MDSEEMLKQLIKEKQNQNRQSNDFAEKMKKRKKQKALQKGFDNLLNL